jgi:hypothetical protein
VHYRLTHMTSDGEARTLASKTAATSTTAAATSTTAKAELTRGGRSRALEDIPRHVTTHKLDWEEDGGKEEEGEEDGGIKFEAWGNDEEAKLTSSPSRRRRGRRKAIHRYWKEWKLICEHTYLLSSGCHHQRGGRIKDGVGKYSGEPRRRDVATDGNNLSEEALKARKEEAEED